MLRMATYDDLDFFILKEIFFSKPSITTWEITIKYFGKNRDLNFIMKKHILIKSRLKRMAKEGLIIISKNKGKNEYNLIKDKIKFCKHKFPNGYKKAILIKNNKWMAFEL